MENRQTLQKGDSLRGGGKPLNRRGNQTYFLGTCEWHNDCRLSSLSCSPAKVSAQRLGNPFLLRSVNGKTPIDLKKKNWAISLPLLYATCTSFLLRHHAVSVHSSFSSLLAVALLTFLSHFWDQTLIHCQVWCNAIAAT